LSAFPNTFCLQRGQRRQDPKHQSAIGRRGINLRASACHDFQANLLLIERVDEPHYMFQVASKSIQLPYDQGVARLQRFSTRGPAGAIICTPRGQVCVSPTGFYPDCHERIPLEVQHLRPVTF